MAMTDDEIKVILNQLAAPIPARDVKRKRIEGSKPYTLVYVTARTVMNRLDSALGQHNWRAEYKPVTVGKWPGVECTLYIRVGGEWIGKADVGIETQIEPLKGAYSEALKRAAGQWGVARELYGDGTAYDAELAAEYDNRTIDDDTGEVTRPASEAQPTTRAQRSTHNPPKPSVADELPPAAAEQMAQELPLGTPRPEDVWVLSKTLYTKTAATMPKGVNWGFQVYEGAKKLGYADEEAVRAVVGVKSLNDWDKTLGELLNTLIDNAPTLAEAA